MPYIFVFSVKHPVITKRWKREKKVEDTLYIGSMTGPDHQYLKAYVPDSSKRYKLACAPIEDSGQPAHPRSLIRVLRRLSMGTKDPTLATCLQAEN